MFRRAMMRVRAKPARPSILWLARDLAIGAAQGAGEWQAVYESGVRCVIDLGAGQAGAGVPVPIFERYLEAPLAGYGTLDQAQLDALSTWAIEHMENDGPVLIYDSQNRNNDGLLAAAALVKRGLPAHLALRALQRVRPNTRLNYAQSAAFVRFAASATVEA